jgi:hypothetical protein
MPWDFGNGRQIADDAAPGVKRVMGEITEAWEHLRRPAVSRDVIGPEDA